jgi:hypothetical protein
MPARIVMVNGDELVVDMDIGPVGDMLRTNEAWPIFEVRDGTEGKRVYVSLQNVAYAEAYKDPEPFVGVVG